MSDIYFDFTVHTAVGCGYTGCELSSSSHPVTVYQLINEQLINNEQFTHTLLFFNCALQIKLANCSTVVYAEIIKVLKLNFDTGLLYETWPEN